MSRPARGPKLGGTLSRTGTEELSTPRDAGQEAAGFARLVRRGYQTAAQAEAEIRMTDAQLESLASESPRPLLRAVQAFRERVLGEFRRQMASQYRRPIRGGGDPRQHGRRTEAA